MLASGPPASPLRIEEKADTAERRLALIATLSLVRTGELGHRLSWPSACISTN